MTETTTEPGAGTLITTPPDKLNLLFTGQDASAIDKIVTEIEKRCRSEKFDPTDEKQREACRSLAYRVSRSKTLLDDTGKAIVDPMNEKIKAVNARRKLARDRLDALRDEVRKPVDAWEKKEAERIETIKARLEGIRNIIESAPSKPIDWLEDYAEMLRNLDITAETFHEFLEQAEALRDDAIRAVDKALDAAREREAERKELEELRRKTAELEARERAASEAQSAPQGAKVEPAPSPPPEKAASRLSPDAVARAEALEDLTGIMFEDALDKKLSADNVLGAIIAGRVRHVRFG